MNDRPRDRDRARRRRRSCSRAPDTQPVPPGTRSIVVQLTATHVSTGYNDGYFDNVSLTLDTGEAPAALLPDLALTKTASKRLAAIGDRITYTLEVENVGDATSHEAFVLDQMPRSGVVFVSLRAGVHAAASVRDHSAGPLPLPGRRRRAGRQEDRDDRRRGHGARRARQLRARARTRRGGDHGEQPGLRGRRGAVHGQPGRPLGRGRGRPGHARRRRGGHVRRRRARRRRALPPPGSTSSPTCRTTSSSSPPPARRTAAPRRRARCGALSGRCRPAVGGTSPSSSARSTPGSSRSRSRCARRRRSPIPPTTRPRRARWSPRTTRRRWRWTTS